MPGAASPQRMLASRRRRFPAVRASRQRGGRVRPAASSLAFEVHGAGVERLAVRTEGARDFAGGLGCAEASQRLDQRCLDFIGVGGRSLARRAHDDDDFAPGLLRAQAAASSDSVPVSVVSCSLLISRQSAAGRSPRSLAIAASESAQRGPLS